MNDHHRFDSMAAAKTALEAPSDQSLRVPCYCEENVWRLAYRKLHHHHHHHNSNNNKNADNGIYYVAFISNPKSCVPMFLQMASADITKPCFWDYHVILLYHSQEHSTTRVLDIDSHLPYACSLDTYLHNAFPCSSQWPQEYMPYFRYVEFWQGSGSFVSHMYMLLTSPFFLYVCFYFSLVEAKTFLKHFSSDRMHMYDAEKDEWSANPPEYDCIQASHETKSNLSNYMTIVEDDIDCRSFKLYEKESYGAIYSLEALKRRFGSD